MNKENKGQKKTSILFRINPEGKTAKMIKQLLALSFKLEFDSAGRIIAKKSGPYNEISKTIIELKDKGFKL